MRILVSESENFCPQARARLAGHEVRLEDLEDRGDLLEAVRDAEVLWIRLRHRIDREVLEAAPDLRFVVSPTTGLNHIDLEAAAERGVEVLSLRGETAFLGDVRATAEHTMALMLALLRRLPAAHEHARDGGWNRDLFRGGELHETTVGLVGHGRLGRIVARYLRAFDAEVLTTDPNVAPDEVEDGVTMVPLAELLERSRIVSLHVKTSFRRRRGCSGAPRSTRCGPGPSS
jgi:D-3-phosphoglycerate dehydrogenase